MKRLRLPALFVLITLLAASPAPAVQEDYDKLLNRGLTNDEPYSYSLIEEARDSQNERELLKAAELFSPDLPAVYFKLSQDALPNVFASIRYGFEGIKAYARNFWWSYSLVSLFFASLLASLVVAAAMVVLIRLPMQIPLLAHDINEGKAKIFIPFLLLPAALGGPLTFIAAALVIIGIHLRKNSRAAVFVFLAFLAASPLLVALSNTMLSAATSPELRAVVAVNEGRNNTYALQTLNNSNNPAAKFSYALALKRVGRYNEALEIYFKLIGENPSDLMVLNNIATTYSAMEQPDKAKEYLNKARNVNSSALVLYNLSQVYRGALDFSTGDKYYKEASSLDHDQVSKYTAFASDNPNRFVIDMTYSIPRLWELAFNKRRTMVSPFPLGKAATAGVAAALIVIAAILYAATRGKAFRCSRCSRIVCNICSRDSRWGQMCPDCYSALVRVQDQDRQKRVSALLAAYEQKDRMRKKVRILSFLPPGIAHIYTGRAMSGMFLLWAFGFLVAAILLNPFIGMGLAGLSHWWLNPVFILTIVILYASTTIYINGRLDSGWL